MIKTTRLPERLELRQRIFLMSRAQRWALWVLLSILLAVFSAMVILSVYRMTEAEWDSAVLLAKLVRNPVDAVINALLLMAVAVQLIYLRLAQRRERLILTPAGIEYRSPLPEALQALRPSWSLAWGQIRAATLKGALRAHDARGVMLELDNGLRKVRISPFQWVDPARHHPLSPWRQMWTLQRAKPEQILASVEDSEVMRFINAAAPHLLPQRSAAFLDTGFALEKNPHALAVVIAFFVLFLYALGDTFVFGHEIYADQPPYPLFVAAGILAAIAAALWLRRAQVPVAESLGVALLFGGALGAAFYPGALRINALTDVEGLQYYEYQLTPALTLSPFSAGLPTLAFPRYADYWSQLKAGSVHYFELRRGGLGFYQLNMQPVEQTLREYYEGQQGAAGATGR